jgi:serine/threonine protein kinase
MTVPETLLLPDLSLEPLVIQATYRGGFGTVYIVKDNEHNEYALKTLSSGNSEDKSALYREALTAAQIKPHINVLAPSGMTTYQGATFIIMPAKADNLRNILKGGSLTADQIGQVISQISLGLAHLHENCGLLHLDLKPENILYDEHGQYMISDFGLSKALPAPSTLQQSQELASKVPAGTFAYMSPEHFVSGELSTKSDIFSLGIIIYELLTGRHPFMAQTLQGLARNIIFSTPDFTISERFKLPRSLKSVCRACLSKAPGNRPSAVELTNALDCFISKRPLMKEKLAQQDLSLAQIQADAGNNKTSEALLKKILTANPFDFFALSLYAQVAFKVGNTQLASSLADEALSAAIWSDHPVSNLQQALLSLSCYYLSIDPVKSIEYAKQVVKANPSDWQALGNLAEAYRLLGGARSRKDILLHGIDACLKAMQLSPNDLKLRVTYGGLLLESGDFQKLSPLVIELANQHANDDVHVRFLLIRTLIATGQHNEADQWLAPMRQYPELEPFIQQANREKDEYLRRNIVFPE